MQVNAAVYSFVMNFMQASNPQITKNYASGNLEAMYSLIIRCSKFSFFIMLMILLPLCAGVDYVLRLWLVDVPAHTVNFVVLTLLYSLVECFLNPLITGMLAQGNIKSFEIGLASLYTVNFMASYVCLKLGMPVETVFVLNIVFKAHPLQIEVRFSGSTFLQGMLVVLIGRIPAVRVVHLYSSRKGIRGSRLFWGKDICDHGFHRRGRDTHRHDPGGEGLCGENIKRETIPRSVKAFGNKDVIKLIYR